MSDKNKLRLSGLFISLMIITGGLFYSIYLQKTIPLEWFIGLIAISAIIGLLISRIRNKTGAYIFIDILESFLPRDIDIMAKAVDRGQIKNEQTEAYIKSRPVLHFFVVTLIVILVAIFITTFIWQALNLAK